MERVKKVYEVIITLKHKNAAADGELNMKFYGNIELAMLESRRMEDAIRAKFPEGTEISVDIVPWSVAYDVEIPADAYIEEVEDLYNDMFKEEKDNA